MLENKFKQLVCCAVQVQPTSVLAVFFFFFCFDVRNNHFYISNCAMHIGPQIHLHHSPTNSFIVFFFPVAFPNRHKWISWTQQEWYIENNVPSFVAHTSCAPSRAPSQYKHFYDPPFNLVVTHLIHLCRSFVGNIFYIF